MLLKLVRYHNRMSHRSLFRGIRKSYHQILMSCFERVGFGAVALLTVEYLD